MKKLFLLVLIILLFSIYNLYAVTREFNHNYNCQNTNIGIRASGMGGAFSSIANDISALYYNPAGLIKDFKLDSNITYSFPKDINYKSTLTEAVLKKEKLPSLIGVSFLFKNISIGLGYYNNYNFNYNPEPFSTTIYDTNGETTAISSFYEKQCINTIAIPLAYKINDNLNIGLTLNQYRLSYEVGFKGHLEISGRKNTNKFGFSMGLLCPFKNKWVRTSIGINYRKGVDLSDELIYSNGQIEKTDISVPQKIFIGLSHRYDIKTKDKSTISLLLSSDLHLEKWKSSTSEVKYLKLPHIGFATIIDKLNYKAEILLGYYKKQSPIDYSKEGYLPNPFVDYSINNISLGLIYELKVGKNNFVSIQYLFD